MKTIFTHLWVEGFGWENTIHQESDFMKTTETSKKDNEVHFTCLQENGIERILKGYYATDIGTNISKIKFKEKDLVCVPFRPFPNQGRNWYRVMFIDNNGTFIGRLEKINDRLDISREHYVGMDYTIDIENVSETYKEGVQWCYSDDTLTCECKGLCREK